MFIYIPPQKKVVVVVVYPLLLPLFFFFGAVSFFLSFFSFPANRVRSVVGVVFPLPLPPFSILSSFGGKQIEWVECLGKGEVYPQSLYSSCLAVCLVLFFVFLWCPSPFLFIPFIVRLLSYYFFSFKISSEEKNRVNCEERKHTLGIMSTRESGREIGHGCLCLDPIQQNHWVGKKRRGGGKIERKKKKRNSRGYLQINPTR